MDGTSRLFIGRDAEMAELSAGLRDAIGGRGGLFLIAGEPGIGKTMLAEQLAALAEAQGALTLWGRCWEGGGAPAYWPWTQILRPLMEPRNSDDAGLVQLLPELSASESAPRPASTRFGLFAAVAALLERASSERPLLVILDDLHAADPASLLLLRFVAGGLRGRRLLIIATYRGLEAERADLAEALGALVRDGHGIRLQGFDRTEAARYVERLTGSAASADEVSRICDATGGNPLFIREMVRLMKTGAGGGWRGAGLSEGIRAVIQQRLAALGADAVRVLSVAAVLGQDFELPLVGRVAGLDADQVRQAIAQAERLDLVGRVPGSDSSLRFSHGLAREVLYGDLPGAARRELHASVAAAIEQMYGADLKRHFGELAYHYAQTAAGGPSPKAAEYARRAGDRALASYAYEEAIHQYRRALDAVAMPSPDESLVCALLLRLGEAQARSGSYQEARGTFVRAADVARRLGDSEALAGAALGVGDPQVEGGIVDQQLLALLREALEALSPQDGALRARLLARLSLELTFADDPALRENLRDSLSRDALAMARRLEDPGALSIALRARWLARWAPDGLEERSALSEDMLVLARDADDRELELVARARRITCSMEAGDTLAVETDIAAHARLAEELRMPYHEWAAVTMRAGWALLQGSFDAAESLAERASMLLAGRPNARLAHLNQTTIIRWEQGRLAELREIWQAMAERFPQAGISRGWLVLADCEEGREDAAAMRLRTLVDALPELPRNGLWLASLAVAALAAARLRDRDAASALYPLLRPYADRTIVIMMPHPTASFGSAELYLGLLAAAAARWDEAGEHFGAALRTNAALGAAAFLARTQCAYAGMLSSPGHATDQARARSLLDQAAAAADRLGMTSLLRDCARLRQPQGEAAPAAPASGERNVLRREGEYWTVAYDDSTVRLRDSKGLRLIARLLGAPGREVHAVDLEAEAAPKPKPQAVPQRPEPTGMTVRAGLGDAGELLDARAKAEYKSRLDDLREDLEEAERFNDTARAAKIKAEIDFLIRELARAVGLGGRDRKAASHAERARLNVTRAIRAALDNIARVHPALGRHLRSTIRTGMYCSYTPDPRAPITWEL